MMFMLICIGYITPNNLLKTPQTTLQKHPQNPKTPKPQNPGKVKN